MRTMRVIPAQSRQKSFICLFSPLRPNLPQPGSGSRGFALLLTQIPGLKIDVDEQHATFLFGFRMQNLLFLEFLFVLMQTLYRNLCHS